MTVPLSDDEITRRVKEAQRRSRLPYAYVLILGLPVVADLIHLPVPHALLWPVTFAIYAIAIGIRTIVKTRKPNPATGVDPLLFRQRFAEMSGATRRRGILISSVSLAALLSTIPFAASPTKGVAVAALLGLVFGFGTAAFLLNIKLRLPSRLPAFRDEELSAMLRGHAAQWGGLIVLMAVVAAFPLVLLRPDSARTVLSVLMWTACEAPLLVFAWLEYRIERNA